MAKNDSETLIYRDMKRYFKNVWLALAARDPFREELEEVKWQLEKADENMQTMQNQLYAALDRWDDCEKRLVRANEMLEAATETAACRQLRGMQQLVENLRERIKDKDAEIDRQGREFRERMEVIKYEYQKRIDEYSREIDELTSKG